MPEPNRTYITTSIEDRLVSWIVAALDAHPTVQVLMANQGGIKLRKPYVTIEILSDRAVNSREELTGNTLGDGSAEICEIASREGTVQILVVGEDSWTVARAIETSIKRQSVVQANSTAGLSIRESISPINNLPNPMSTINEQRRTQDFAFSYVDNTILDAGSELLEQAIVTGDLYTQTPGDGVTVNVDESWPSP